MDQSLRSDIRARTYTFEQQQDRDSKGSTNRNPLHASKSSGLEGSSSLLLGQPSSIFSRQPLSSSENLGAPESPNEVPELDLCDVPHLIPQVHLYSDGGDYSM